MTEEIDCRKFHAQCKARCCKTIAFAYPKNLNLQYLIDYFVMHEGIKVIEDGNMFLFVVDAKCKNLNDDLSCKIYKTRPLICMEGYDKNKNSVIFHEGCGYPLGKDSLVVGE